MQKKTKMKERKKMKMKGSNKKTGKKKGKEEWMVERKEEISIKNKIKKTTTHYFQFLDFKNTIWNDSSYIREIDFI